MSISKIVLEGNSGFAAKDKGPAIIQRSMVQISARFLDKIHNMLGRMRVLAMRIPADKDIKPYKK